jgi:putative endonuclease
VLVYYEQYDGVEDAIKREKQIKAGSRRKKVALIDQMNKNWDDLSENFFGDL